MYPVDSHSPALILSSVYAVGDYDICGKMGLQRWEKGWKYVVFSSFDTGNEGGMKLSVAGISYGNMLCIKWNIC